MTLVPEGMASLASGRASVGTTGARTVSEGWADGGLGDAVCGIGSSSCVGSGRCEGIAEAGVAVAAEDECECECEVEDEDGARMLDAAPPNDVCGEGTTRRTSVPLRAASGVSYPDPLAVLPALSVVVVEPPARSARARCAGLDAPGTFSREGGLPTTGMFSVLMRTALVRRALAPNPGWVVSSGSMSGLAPMAPMPALVRLPSRAPGPPPPGVRGEGLAEPVPGMAMAAAGFGGGAVGVGTRAGGVLRRVVSSSWRRGPYTTWSALPWRAPRSEPPWPSGGSGSSSSSTTGGRSEPLRRGSWGEGWTSGSSIEGLRRRVECGRCWWWCGWAGESAGEGSETVRERGELRDERVEPGGGWGVDGLLPMA